MAGRTPLRPPEARKQFPSLSWRLLGWYAARMLHEFLTANRLDLLARCQARVAQRHAPSLSSVELQHGIPLFLDQLIKMLQAEEGTTEPGPHDKKPNESNQEEAGTEMGVAATRHGRELMQRGFSVEQVVHAYGDLCQEVTGLAMELHAPIQVEEFRTLNRCLDNGIADAVTEFALQRDTLMADAGTGALNERLASLAHELRNLTHKVMMAITVIKSGKAGFAGATGVVLDHSLLAMGNLIDRSLAEVRISAGMPAQYQLISVADFISDVKISASLEADVYECRLTVSIVDPTLAVEADRDMLFRRLEICCKTHSSLRRTDPRSN